MRQVELRLAVVLYGGVSLAIYMHGVTRELLGLQRASRALDKALRSGADLTQVEQELTGSAVHYFRLLRDLRTELDLRVVIDAISGTSAGGINGIMLARALAHDLPLDPHRAFWLEKADVTELARPPHGASRWVKRLVAPVVGRALGLVLDQDPGSTEARRKLHWFMSSRWFKPPFSGERFSRWMLEACQAMDACDQGNTLIPVGQKLELFVTLTDYFGKKHTVPLYHQTRLEEIEHRRMVRFSARNDGVEGLKSQLGADCAASNVFAARATASFPGAFPPASIEEVAAVVEQLNLQWPDRERFVQEVLQGPLDTGKPRLFIDGSVVMNKPFQPVIDSIDERAASREVVRRLLYVDPIPGEPATGDTAEFSPPGFFRSILASLAYIPRNEPVGDNLKEIERMNARSRRLREVIGSVQPDVDREVRALLAVMNPKHPPVEQVRRARESAMDMARQHSGFVHPGYAQVRLSRLVNRIAKLVKRLGANDNQPRATERLEQAIGPLMPDVREAFHPYSGESGSVNPLYLDVDYRIRCLRSVIRKVNSLYANERLDAGTVERLGHLKGRLYEIITYLQYRWSRQFYGRETREACGPMDILNRDKSRMETVLFLLHERMGLIDLDHLTDEVICTADNELSSWLPDRPILRAYLGFSFYDAVMLPIQQTLDHTELGEVAVSRISPKDPGVLRPEGTALKGAQLQTFGAFFNRSWREHDYLWGRLNAAERLASLLANVVSDNDAVGFATSQLRGLFESILDEEADHLKADLDLVPGLRGLIDTRLTEAAVDQRSLSSLDV